MQTRHDVFQLHSRTVFASNDTEIVALNANEDRCRNSPPQQVEAEPDTAPQDEVQQQRSLLPDPVLPCAAECLRINRAGTYALVYGHEASDRVRMCFKGIPCAVNARAFPR